jgi:hypothetical protein
MPQHWIGNFVRPEPVWKMNRKISTPPESNSTFPVVQFIAVTLGDLAAQRRGEILQLR